MPTITLTPFSITVDQVIRAQGMNPQRVRQKSPKLIDLTAKAIEKGVTHLQPQAIYEELGVVASQKDSLWLSNGKSLSGELIGQVLADAEKVFIIVCTIGTEITEITSQIFADDPALGMAMEGLASAAVEVAGNRVCEHIGRLAAADGLHTGVPINPGMIGWPVEEGQPQIFACLDTTPIGVSLTAQSLMLPLKSLSMVIGSGKNLQCGGNSCDYCNLQKTCNHKQTDGQP